MTLSHANISARSVPRLRTDILMKNTLDYFQEQRDRISLYIFLTQGLEFI
jgi:hypothetical protein